MMKGWKEEKLVDILSVLRNGVNCKQDKNGQGEKISRIESIADATFNSGKVGYAKLSIIEKNRYRLFQGDILFSHINSAIHVGKTAIFDLDDEIYHGVNLLLMRPKPEIDSYYLNYWLKQIFQTGYWRRVCKQSVNQASVNQKDISKVEIRYPPLPEQRRIVEILDEAFEAIATAKANAEKSLILVGELGDKLRNGIFSTIAEVTKRRRLGEVCQFVRGPFGGSLKKNCFVEHGYAVYEQSHAIHDQFSIVRYFVSAEKFEEMRRFELLPNDLIMSCSGTMGKVAIAPSDLRRGIINQALLKLTPGDVIEAEYLKYWMESRDFQDALAQCSGGAAIQNVASVSVLKEILIPLPSVDQQKLALENLHTVTTDIDRFYVFYKQKLSALDELKKSLLHYAFTGQLTAKKTDELVGAVA